MLHACYTSAREAETGRYWRVTGQQAYIILVNRDQRQMLTLIKQKTKSNKNSKQYRRATLNVVLGPLHTRRLEHFHKRENTRHIHTYKKNINIYLWWD